MKKYLIPALVCLAVCVSATAQAQKQKKQHVNRFDSTLARKHELIISPGVVGNPMYDYRVGGRGGSFNLEYARVYKSNHFLRAGLRFSQDSRGGESRLHTPASIYNDPSTPGGTDLPLDKISQEQTGRGRETNSFIGALVGYEYGVGVRRFRFTFGADLHVGYNNRVVYNEENWFTVNRTYDMTTNLFHYDIQATRSGPARGNGQYLFMAVSPRLGLRHELGRRIALAITFTPQVGYTQRLGYSEIVQGDRPVYYYHPKSLWFASANAELRLIIKLGKS